MQKESSLKNNKTNLEEEDFSWDKKNNQIVLKVNICKKEKLVPLNVIYIKLWQKKGWIILSHISISYAMATDIILAVVIRGEVMSTLGDKGACG